MTTIKQVAKKAGVSIVTVDRILHGRGGYSRDTEERIKRTIKELNYSPDVFARQLRLAKTFLFGVVMPYPKHNFDYWQLPCKGINKAKGELMAQRVKVKYYFYDITAAHAFSGIEKRIAEENVDGLLIAPNLWEQTRSFLERIPPQLPYIFFDTKIPETGFLSYIGQNPYKSGSVSAKLMKILVREPGSIAIVNITPSDYHIEERIAGFVAFFRKNPGYKMKIFSVESKTADTASRTLAERVIDEENDLRGFFLPATPVFRVAECLHNRTLTGKIHIIGYDLTKLNRKHLRNGTIDFIISQNPEQQGYEGIHLLYRHCLLNETVPREVLLPIDIITKENLPSP